MTDRSRFLSAGLRRSDYTHRPVDPLRAGQALNEDEQELLTERSRRAHTDLMIVEWGKASTRILTALGHFTSVGQPGLDLEHKLRAVERTTRAVDRHLGL